MWLPAAAMVAVITLTTTVKGWWRATLGKRHALIKNHRKLAPLTSAMDASHARQAGEVISRMSHQMVDLAHPGDALALDVKPDLLAA